LQMAFSLAAQEAAAPAAPATATETTPAGSTAATDTTATTTDATTTTEAGEDAEPGGIAATGRAAAEGTAAESTGEEQPEDLLRSQKTRRELINLLDRSPDRLATLLALEPSLLANDSFLAGHPDLAEFVAAHPEVRLQPSFYLSAFADRAYRSGPLEQIMEPLAVFIGFSIVAYTLMWLIRTIVEQKRWSRLSRTQSEVHNKILDRFGTSAELLDYVKTPAGTKFLESAPIPLRAEREQVNQTTPMTRIMWSVQLGVVMTAAALGLLLVSLRYSENEGQGLFALGAIALCLGFGFIGSAAVTIFLSRRLGVWQEPAAAPPHGGRTFTHGSSDADDTGLVR
ncbi:MAG TPA: hypothetical protein VE010_14950, partial [Thermoanaerobaculia bacterium]|nr:hypothetical protein [Thermoanaerobaculia bacterium]